jgi:hypothetical protein
MKELSIAERWEQGIPHDTSQPYTWKSWTTSIDEPESDWAIEEVT